jgi:hypothetical protein
MSAPPDTADFLAILGFSSDPELDCSNDSKFAFARGEQLGGGIIASPLARGQQGPKAAQLRTGVWSQLLLGSDAAAADSGELGQHFSFFAGLHGPNSSRPSKEAAVPIAAWYPAPDVQVSWSSII